MSLSRQQRITILLFIDTIFFFAEIISGYYVGSLALIADSFHMLNDVMSLIVAAYAIKLAGRTTFDSNYSYGWQRAEVLGALINGVFLLALCFSIFVEALERLYSPQGIVADEIRKPLLVLGVGCAGLASNIIGLILFHEHSHEGHSHSSSAPHSHTKQIETQLDHERSLSTPLDEILVCGHPSQVRQSVLAAGAELKQKEKEEGNVEEDEIYNDNDDDVVVEEGDETMVNTGEGSSAISKSRDRTFAKLNGDSPIPASQSRSRPPSYGSVDRGTTFKNEQEDENNAHTQEKPVQKSHKNLNMQGVFLHVLGDALGNIGVIATALFIQYTTFEWKNLADPIISASSILLQAVPSGIPIDEVRSKLLRTQGVQSVHELHIWQLSDTKLIASVHVHLDQSRNYMTVAANIRRILHLYGIHSATIQPEYKKIEPKSLNTVTDSHEESHCLLRCADDNSCEQHECCSRPAVAQQPVSYKD
ncbi:hypothetical protein G9A89_018454 [Geosiphon pyriformis]|nr:hypothetical protein G9A89_018454 [Geosiphon pyriformis]